MMRIASLALGGPLLSFMLQTPIFGTDHEYFPCHQEKAPSQQSSATSRSWCFVLAQDLEWMYYSPTCFVPFEIGRLGLLLRPFTMMMKLRLTGVCDSFKISLGAIPRSPEPHSRHFPWVYSSQVRPRREAIFVCWQLFKFLFASETQLYKSINHRQAKKEY